MSVPKHETIVRHCTNGTAVGILEDRGILAPHEAADLHARARALEDRAYARVYDRPRHFLHPFIDGPLCAYCAGGHGESENGCATHVEGMGCTCPNHGQEAA